MMDPATDFAAQLYGLGAHSDYLRAAGELLSMLFPSEGVGWAEVDAAARTAEIFAHPDMPVDVMAERLVDTADDNPVFRSYLAETNARIWQPRRLSDFVTDTDLHQTRTYTEGLRPLGIDRQIVFVTGRMAPAWIRLWSVNRLRRDFSDGEVELAGRLQPMLRLLELAYGGSGQPSQVETGPERYALTRREHEIVELLGRGLTGTAIGHLLGISPRTVSKHIQNAYAKLGCTNRIDALRKLRGGE